MVATGDVAVRAAHSLSAHPGVEGVVVLGPAKSRSFEVVANGDSCDYIVGTGDKAVERAKKEGLPLIWDGDQRRDTVSVWGANAKGLTLALAAREPDPRLVAVAHPKLDAGDDQQARFPDPLGTLRVTDGRYGARRLATAKSPNQFAACLALGAKRSVTIVDHGEFMSGVALAAGIALADGSGSRAVWESALDYLNTAAAMGLVLAEGSSVSRD